MSDIKAVEVGARRLRDLSIVEIKAAAASLLKSVERFMASEESGVNDLATRYGPAVFAVIGSHVYDRTETYTTLTLRDGAMLFDASSTVSDAPEGSRRFVIDVVKDEDGFVATLKGMENWHLASDGPTVEIALARLGETMFYAGGGRAVSDEVSKAVVVALNEFELSLGIPQDAKASEYIAGLVSEIERLKEVLQQERARVCR